MQCLFMGGIWVLFALHYLGTKIPTQARAERELEHGGSREKKMMKERSRKTKGIWSFKCTYNHFINLEQRNLKSWSHLGVRKLEETCCPAQMTIAFFGMLISGEQSFPLFHNLV